MSTFFHDYFSKATEKQLVFLWLIFCFVVLSYKLDGVPPYHSDENFYVESSRNMVESGDYLTPVYHDKKRFAKPILYYWFVSASYKIFGVNLTSARLASAFFGCLTIGLLYLISSRLFEGRIAFYSILILPATFLHFQISRWATTDIVMSFFILLALYFFVRLYQSDFKERSDIYLFYLAMALGFMTKGPPAIIIPAMVVLIFLVATKRTLFQLCIGQGGMILLVVILPWFATMYFLHGDEFTNHIIGAEIKARLAHGTPLSLYYFGVLFRYYLPWSLFFLVAVLHQFGLYSYSLSPVSGLSEYFKQIPANLKAQVRLLFVRENESVLFCYIWILVCLILFILVRTEHSRYMLPASSAVAILTAKFFADMEKHGSDWPGYKIPVILTGIIFILIGLFSGVGLYSLDSFYPAPLRIFALPVVFFFGGIAVMALKKTRQAGKQVFAISFALVLAFSFLSGDVLSHASRYPMKLFAEKILSEKFSGPIVVYQLGNQRARLGVLTGQKVLTIHSPEQLEEFLATEKQVRIVMRQADFRDKFPDVPLKIVAEDIAWLDGRVDWERTKELFGKAESADFSNLTEKIYLLTNK
ncbi:MAG: glycosyltransferase family 39 protein [Nitrospina sp.]|nr:glycosyltransferase family 39 protein [Nitrospina sp.]MBT3413836.1 glycosyltransferase family 39 protein [Nitrospina sp.]MBT3856699.1 glycosyltransferase family 39 protein [Nitrospina sp.]MBT4105870.1 glycosyltransferase family 39 protein [Nitrospina sp.]MBT4390588.1 glycosyltransferase family 39 protein [Nitrospina sp.]